ncbi:DUF4214 domain-containing protein [Iamia majanohamensis]|uniref:DUF4214 domain-containing protein n=1 Tax=Iamia majanohamensis TaxID=467976 RepID=A0AAF0BUU6_9ACTN|nr:DUF4214 domain-containing protein [Iamia majanohamensis]WCO66100.1 DUF4214 domain-containing protein [Iamia majanohamensis]
MALVALVLGAVLLPAPSGAQPGPTLAVDPATDIGWGQPVTVTGSGFTPGAEVLLRQCTDATTDDCDRWAPTDDAGGNGQVVAGQDGSLSLTMAFAEVVRNDNLAEEPCSVGGCTLQASEGREVRVVLPLDLSGEEHQWPEADLQVGAPEKVVLDAYDPDPTRRTGEVVAVSASGLDPFHRMLSGPSSSGWSAYGPYAAIEVCGAGPDPAPEDCAVIANATRDLAGAPNPTVEADGTAEAEVVVPPTVDVPSGALDCVADGCTLALTQGGNPVTNRVPLDWVDEWWPWPTAGEASRQVLASMTGTTPSASQVAAIAADLDARRTLMGALVTYLAVGGRPAVGDVTRLYLAYFDRLPDPAGLGHWVARLEGGDTASRVSRAFSTTGEYRVKVAGLTDAEMVDTTYELVLHRAPDADGRAYWIGRLGEGLPRWKLVLFFAQLAEGRVMSAHRVAAVALTTALLGRTPTSSEVAVPTRVLADVVTGSPELAAVVGG